jgi:hypothetical protein
MAYNYQNRNQTYEEASALASAVKTADPIHYNPSYAYRNSAYRHLHHQNGKIGTFTVRVIEARNLKRRHWSVLGLGPVKYLGLSRAHGQVSSCAVLRLGFRPRKGQEKANTIENTIVDKNAGMQSAPAHNQQPNASFSARNISPAYSVDSFSFSPSPFENKSIASAVSISLPFTSTPASIGASSISSFAGKGSVDNERNPGKSNESSLQNADPGVNTYYSKIYKSTTVRSNSNPNWPTVQSPNNQSIFAVELHKGMPIDGMQIFLQIQMREEKTAADTIVPVFKGGDDLLGESEIDVTELVLRGFGDSKSRAKSEMPSAEAEIVDVWDRWINLDDASTTQVASTSASQHTSNTNRNSLIEENRNLDESSRVRIMISYEPNGFNPRRGDIVALESFARLSIFESNSRPIIPPLHPFRVKDIRGEYILCSFDTNFSCKEESSSSGKAPMKIGSTRLHRNAVFVIERTNIVDSTLDVALKPADAVLSTSIGKEVSDVVQPYVESAGDLLMPALLSAKLFLQATTVGSGAVIVGVKSAAAAVVESQNPRRRRKTRRSRTFSD